MNRRDTLRLGAAMVAGLAASAKLKAERATPGAETTDSFWDVIRTRRSVRQFKPDPVPQEHLLRIVDAARMAPCAGNEQPWKFVIIQDKKVIDALRDECVRGIEARLRKNSSLTGDAFAAELQKMVDTAITGRLSAPAYIVVLADGGRKYPDYNWHDGPLAAGYLLLAARALGYGTLYMTDSIPVEVTKKVLNIPDRYVRVCITPIGVPLEWPAPKGKKALEDFVVRDRF